MAKFELRAEDDYGYWLKRGSYNSFDEAFDKACELHDSGKDMGDFAIVEVAPEGNFGRIIHSHQLEKEPCPICGKEVRNIDMVMTVDCRGIPFRRVCSGCWIDIVDGKGYDGEYYDELDECIDDVW